MSNKKYGITLNGVEHEVIISPNGSDNYNVTVDGDLYPVSIRTMELENISNHVLGLVETSHIYTGEEIRPELITDGTVINGTDFNVTYSNNIEVGTGSVTVIGDGNYSGVVSFEFTITSSEEVIENPSETTESSTDMISDDSTTENTSETVENTTNDTVVSDDEPVTVEEKNETVVDNNSSESKAVSSEDNTVAEETNKTTEEVSE